MKSLMIALLVFVGASAFAYKDGTYTCKNIEGLPNNVYKITTVSMGEGLPGLPFVEIDRYYHESDASSPVAESHIQGLASVATMKDGSQILAVGALHLEFSNDQLLGCKAP